MPKSQSGNQPNRNHPKLGVSYWKLWSATAISNLGDGVSMIAYPWLASAVTRSPFLIALSGVLSRLPWLIFSLPAGVITDRYDRKKIIVMMDSIRGLLTVTVAGIVFFNSDTLPSLNELASLTDLKTNWALFITISLAAFLFGLAEVLRDNSAQTFMPSVVKEEHLEKANGQMWSAESLTNSFIGPPLGSLFIGVAVFIPFFFDAASFFMAAALIASITTFKKVESRKDETAQEKRSFRTEIKEGFSWLWAHELLRPMAIILGLLNFVGTLAGAGFILFAQEILHTNVMEFAILGTAGAVGGILGGLLAPKISQRIGSGPSLWLTLGIGPIIELIIGLSSSWYIVWILTAFATMTAILWNVITVSLRQSIIPSHLLGRVNSVYRFFAWGTIPIGALVAGFTMSGIEKAIDREWGLRAPYLLSAVIGFLLFIFAAPKLTTSKIEGARAVGKG